MLADLLPRFISLLIVLTTVAWTGPVGATAGGQGKVFTFYLKSEAVRQQRRVRVYLPPGYDAESESRYPVIYALHGLRSTEVAFFKMADLAETLDAKIASGEVAPAIVVAPSGYDGYWTNHVATRRKSGEAWGDYVVHEVVTEVDRRFRTRPHSGSRALVGVSMGGFGAVSLGLQYPEVFGAVVSLSGALFTAPPSHRRVYLKAWGDPPDMAHWDRVSPLDLLRRIDPLLAPPLYIQCGERDELGFAEYAQLAGMILEQRGIPGVVRITAGTHGWRTWARETTNWLHFVDAAWN